MEHKIAERGRVLRRPCSRVLLTDVTLHYIVVTPTVSPFNIKVMVFGFRRG